MKILYSVQATGNGHISRAMELLPHLREYGEVDIFLSGDNSTLSLDAPIKYRSRGLSLYYNCNGGLDYFQIMRGFQPFRLRQEIRDLPVEKYDLVLNDFDYITAAACARKKVPSIQFGHQASFQSPHTPRPPKRAAAGEWVLKNYARASRYVGLHFESYADFIFSPVVKKEILEAEPFDLGHITVYLPSYCKQQLLDAFMPLTDMPFDIFCGQVKHVERHGHITLLPVTKAGFNQSLIFCHALITGGGFETPAEAIHLGKKVMTIPIKSQYEQQCNAAAMQQMGITRLKEVGLDFNIKFEDWMNNGVRVKKDYRYSAEQALGYLFGEKMSGMKEEMLLEEA